MAIENVGPGGVSRSGGPRSPESLQYKKDVAGIGNGQLYDEAGNAVLTLPEVINVLDFFKPGDNAIGSAWQTLLNQAPAGSSIYFPPSLLPYNFDIGSGATAARKRLRLFSDTYGAKIVFVPTAENDIWFQPNAVGLVAGNPNVTDELQLDGFVIENLRITSDRSIKAHAILARKVDNASLVNVFIWGFKGYSVNMQNSREWNVVGFRTRYNGYVDPDNAVNNTADFIMGTTSGLGDTTNFCKFTNSFLIFPMGQALNVSGAVTNQNMGELMVHALPRANTALETNYLRYFTEQSAGFNNSGIANNDYAALHASPGTSAPNVSGLSWAAWKRDCFDVVVRDSSNIRIGNGQHYGSQAAGCIWADNGSRVTLSNYDVTGAISTQYAPTVNFSTISDDALTVPSPAPTTATPVVFDLASGSLPSGLSSRRAATFYAIRINDTQIKFATSRANALAGTAITLASTVGTATMTSLIGYDLLATQGSTITVDNTTRLTDGFQPAFADFNSFIYGDPNTGAQANAWGGGPTLPSVKGEQVLFVIRNANLQSTTNQPFTKVYGGRRYIPTRAVAVNKNGQNGSAAVGGIYCGLTGTPRTDQIVSSAQAWTNIGSTAETALTLTLGAAASKTNTFGTDSASTVVLGLDTPSVGACLVDIFIYGIVSD